MWSEPSEEWKEGFKAAFQVTNHPFLQLPSIAPKKIICIDKDVATLSKLGAQIDSNKVTEQQQSLLRFSQLKVELNATDYRNIDFPNVEIDVLVASEFIEHLEDDCLDEFGPRVLGDWKPKEVIITTPNYSFNVKFKNDQHRSTKYKDPTGRTDRVFRHSDHKFEWTKNEFRSWIEKIAEKYEYQAKFDEVGKGYQRIDGEKQEDLTDGEDARCASQCCILTRIWPKEQSESSIAQESEVSYRTAYTFMASDIQVCEDEGFDTFEDAFEDLAIETEEGLMANLYQIWLDEEVRKAYHGRLESFLPNAKSMQGKGYTMVVKEGDIYILKKAIPI
ncbi:uncharacterized protein FA14DRAFT_51709 [Meira miltonrushii]|uniref:Small RNA 2'-O-methyltransferase n=1 Tax=Meira miltonrushii TaxID=1280837 RepID=A0A316VJ85_9BASI|nr:uncharacterized protein FA14DRAFT_51709 [Meira miltonrushii]PWN36091.1 hypothetical protein FA14DRAFT_51709 [Meira miltonrushii]